MNIPIETINNLVEEADQILFTPEGEQALLQLLEVKDKVDEALDSAKKRIGEAAVKINPNFKCVVGENVKVSYRSFGSKYTIDPAKADSLPPELVKIMVKATPNAKEIDRYIAEHGMPDGVSRAERTNQVVIKRLHV